MRFAGVTRAELEDQVAALLAAESVPIIRERKGREEHDDLRPSVLAMAVSETQPSPTTTGGQPSTGPPPVDRPV